MGSGPSINIHNSTFSGNDQRIGTINDESNSKRTLERVLEMVQMLFQLEVVGRYFLPLNRDQIISYENFLLITNIVASPGKTFIEYQGNYNSSDEKDEDNE